MPRKEKKVTDDEVDEVCCTVGNLIRVAMVVQPEQAQAACEAINRAGLEILLLDPRLPPRSPAQHQLNRRLLNAFVSFRLELELIREGMDSGGGPPA